MTMSHLLICAFLSFAAVLSSTSAFSPVISKPSASVRLQSGLFGGLFGGSKPVDPDVPTRILEIPAKSIKPGPLRFFLGVYLVGEQNKPEPGSWQANTNAGDDIIELYYKDASAKTTVGLSEYGVTFDRVGAPSLQYLLQESVLLHGLLDELNSLAFLEDVEEDKRLIRIADPGDAIEKAREKLPARKD
mmetsp:Transcript_19732/g.23681  ORF Transcript_19732/g.23681 Transcript_19732/m.23681 type:complete len:189 (-) Transcript_19732:145-711(-)